MAHQVKLYLFGDQTYDVEPQLPYLMKARDDLFLNAFLRGAYGAIRKEIYNLPPSIREDLPRFTCLEDFVTWKQTASGKRCIALDMTVTTLYQIGAFILQSQAFYDSTGDTLVAGLCTGNIAAAAVSCSKNLTDLIPLGIMAVVTSFRTGLLVSDVARRLQTGPADDRHWSIALDGAASTSHVEQYNEQCILPLISRPDISSYAPNSITVSGPPDTISTFLASEPVQKVTTREVPIFGPYHASHLYSTKDVASVLAGLFDDAQTSASEVTPLISIPNEDSDVRPFPWLLEEAVAEILLRPIQWQLILTKLHVHLQHVAPQAFKTISIGSNAHSLIYNALRKTDLAPIIPPSRPTSTFEAPPPVLSSGATKPKLAIIGMSGRFPDAENTEAFWNILHQGLDVHKTVPAQHWDARTHVDTSANPRKNTSATPFGCWLKDPDLFDARFFNISPKEAAQIDPAQRLALMTAYEAIERAGIVPDATPSTRPDRVGVFYGVTSNDWMETNSAQNIDAHMIPGGNRAFIPGRINYFFKFSGPSYAVDTACSSSLAGIHLACNALWNADIDTAIAGGTNILTNPDFTAGLDRGHFLSRTGNCKTFDDGADGYCRGEGIATVIIKRLDDAIADEDPILGVILGAYTNHSAESESITRPHVDAQRAIFSKVLNEAGVDPKSVSYIEMHGTGTQAGDAAEMSSVLETFAPALTNARSPRTEEQALYLGSAKSNIGHGEAASGASSLIKVLMMMQKNIIVPHCGIKTKLNHKFPADLEKRQVRIALEPTPWKRSSHGKARRVLVNNFSAAGGNSALLLEDAPSRSGLPATTDSRNQFGIAVTAKGGASLQGNLRTLLKFLESNTETSCAHLSYTTTARRIHHPHRLLFVTSSVEDLSDKIRVAIRDELGTNRPKSTPRAVFSFTGQGAQYPGMARQLLRESPTFHSELLRLEQIAVALGYPEFLSVIESEEKDISIFTPSVVQLASICIQMALVKLWKSWNVVPSVVVGHSLGEYAALNTAGVLSDVDTIFLVGLRARLLEQLCTRNTHAMLVIDGPLDRIEKILQGHNYEVACINSPTETVLAGSQESMPVLQDALKQAELRSTLLKVPYAFHSSQVDVILKDFTAQAAGARFSTPEIPVIRPLDCDTSGSAIFDAAYLASHSRAPVNMLGALTSARNANIITDRSMFLEVGPHPAVSKMVKSTLGTSTIAMPTLQRGAQPWDVLIRSLKTFYEGGSAINWRAYQENFAHSHALVQLPSYAWDVKPYWIQYVNDWSLRKGDPPLRERGPSLESTTIHSVISETGDANRTNIIVEADITRKDLSPLVQGHEVDGIPLCTPSVYADIALTLGTYLRDRYQNDDKKLVDVTDMTISKALILNESASKQLIQIHSDSDWSTGSTLMKFMSFSTQDKLQEHARCVVRLQDDSLRRQLSQQAQAIQGKMRALRAGIATGETARFNRAMVYRAIRPLARFHDDYRAIDEIVLNSKTLEASSTLSFGSVKRDGDFHTHPAIIDSLTQACGFAMNCNDNTDLDVEVFMNHGWGSLQLFEPMDFDKIYTTYTRMEPGPDKLWRGDAAIFDGDKIVAHFGQIAIQGVPRRVLKVILSIESGKKGSGASAPTPRSAPVETPSVASPPVTSAQPSRGPSPVDVGLQIIADESEVALAGLTDDTNFADMGVDSLLGLTISARFREQLDLDLDFNALLFEHPTIGDLKAFLRTSFPGADHDVSGALDTVVPAIDQSASTITPQNARVAASSVTDVKIDRALEIIAEESGVKLTELDDDTNLADCGVDSLLSLIIVSRFRNELDFDMENESMFLEQPTIGDLKKVLAGGSEGSRTPDTVDSDSTSTQATSPSIHGADDFKVASEDKSDSEVLTTLESEQTESLIAREQAVDVLVEQYSSGFFGPGSKPTAPAFNDKEKVVLVTGGSGSLGGHLVYHLAQLDDVKTVVCLNRKHKDDPVTYQLKAMRDKGIRFPEALKSKLLVLQTDTSKPQLGLDQATYDKLAGSVSHVVHQAWPMSATRALAGFEAQFQVMRNLIDLARDVASSHRKDFKLSFQMVSSIGVVGLYEQHKKAALTVVPEAKAKINSVLGNGYSEAKWTCERMLDETLVRFPDRFRTMVARLGQIAGSKTSGYWNPMEHFGFLVKSSQSLNALPDVDGKLYWTPVNDVAGTLADLVLANNTPHAVYHVDNPNGQSWKEMNRYLQAALRIPNLIPFEQWLDRVRQAPQKNNPAQLLSEFLESNYLRMSCGGLVLDVSNSLEHSPTLQAMGEVPEKVVRKYIHIWKEIGFLHASEEDKAGFEAERRALWS